MGTSNNNFFKDNIISIISLCLTIGGLLFHVGVTQAELKHVQEIVIKIQAEGSNLSQRNNGRLATLETQMRYDKEEIREKVKEIEGIARENNKQVSEQLKGIGEKMAVVIAWIEEQKRLSQK